MSGVDRETVFIGAGFERQAQVREWAAQFEALGYRCDMRWMTHNFECPGGLQNPRNRSQARACAIEDIEDVLEANIVVIEVLPMNATNARLVEMGMALINAHELWLINGRTANIYGALEGDVLPSYYLADLKHFLTMDDAIQYAKER